LTKKFDYLINWAFLSIIMNDLYLAPTISFANEANKNETNLLQNFGMSSQFNSSSSEPDTFKAYISHLPGTLKQIIESCKEEPGIKSLLDEPNNNNNVNNNINEEIDFQLLSETQLRNAFTLQVGTVIRKVEKQHKHKHKHKRKHGEMSGNTPPSASSTPNSTTSTPLTQTTPALASTTTTTTPPVPSTTLINQVNSGTTQATSEPERKKQKKQKKEKKEKKEKKDKDKKEKRSKKEKRKNATTIMPTATTSTIPIHPV